MLPDRPLTGLEWLASGVIGGAFRPIFRDASALFKNGDVIVRASTDAAVGGTNVVAAKMLINEIAEVRFSPISVDDQVTAAFFRSLVVGGSFLVSVFLIAIFSGKLQLHAQNIVFVIVGCLVVGFLLSFLPAYLKLNKDLIQLLLITANDKVLVLVIEPATKETALRVCDANGLKISDTTVI